MPSELPTRLVADSTSLFYAALAELRRVDDASLRDLLPETLVLLSRSATLPERRKAERASTILSRQAISPALAGSLVARSGEYNAAVRNALSTVLPPEFRARSLTTRHESEPAPEVPEKIGFEALGTTGTQEENVEKHTPMKPSASARIDEAEESGAGVASIVLVLSKHSDQERNIALLRNSGFDPLHFESWDAARTDMANMADICGCLIDESFISDMDSAQQLGFFRDLGRYSSFTWLRIDDNGLRLGLHELREAVRKARCLLAPVAADAISIRSGRILAEAEIPDLIRAQSLLRSHLSARVHPRQLSTTEAQLLTAALRKSFEESRYDRAAPKQLIEVEFLQGGYSSARTVLVRIEGAAKPEIAKVDKRDRVVEEIERFYTFIQNWDPELQPRAFFHADAALILFGIIPDDADATQPAAMLGQSLESLWNAEVFAGDERGYRELSKQAENLTGALSRAAEKLFTLNVTRCATTEFTPHGYPSPNFLENLTRRGIAWNLLPETGSAIEKAKSRFDELHGRAVVHGDLHLGNVLIRGERDPHLIDYASSGPGHPAIDLVRLEMALFLGNLRQLESDDRYLSLQRAFSLDLLGMQDLRQGWGQTLQCATNRVCVAGCIAARDFAMRAVQAHGGTRKDYLAAKYLVALQSLVMHRRQTSLTCGVINALTPEIAAWD